MDTVIVKCKGSGVRDISQLDNFQGDLKVLSEENYTKMKKEILELGFCEPVTIWKNKILNGHQRVKTLTRMKEEGYEIPKIPVNVVDAKDKKEAKKIILSLTSQFGKITNQGLYDFMKEAEIDLSEVMESFSFSDINMKDVESLFGTDEINLEFEDIDDSEVPDVDLEGTVPNKTTYIVVTFDDGENVNHILEQIGIRNHLRRVDYKTFHGAIKSGKL